MVEFCKFEIELEAKTGKSKKQNINPTLETKKKQEKKTKKKQKKC
jgi:hypothetical protein